MASLSVVGSGAAPKPAAAVFIGNQIRPALFSGQLIAKAGRKAANPTRRNYVANSAAPNVADPLTAGNGNFALFDELHEDGFQTSAHSVNGHRPHRSFRPPFVFGAASSAFQVEGATDIGGKAPSIWDTFCKNFPGKIAGGANGEPGAGSYELYQEDVDLIYDIGLNGYRFSISWPRVLPTGKKDHPNEDGIRYYNRLIDALIAKGIEPYVTIFHWDVPQALEDEYGGFLSRKIIEDYKGFAELCFERFGDRVKHWITMNEPSVFANYGYCYGQFAPGHCSPDLKDYICPVGDSLREPYRVGHNILLAHSEGVKLYRDNYKAKQGGQIGITLTSMWYEPYDNRNPLDIEAQKRALEFNLGWFLDPLKFGKYPFSMRSLVGERLPNFTAEESEKLIDSFDFIGINYYSSRYAKDTPYDHTHKPVMSADDVYVDIRVLRKGEPIGPSQKGSWINVYPKGLHKLLVYMKNRYSNPPVYITENGVLKYDTEQTESQNLNGPRKIDDIFRIDFHNSHIQALEDALCSGADVRGYFVWSLLDSFEWRNGYTGRFGLVHVDRQAKLKRYPKQSAIWLRDFMNRITSVKPAETTHVLLPHGRTIIKEKQEDTVEVKTTVDA